MTGDAQGNQCAVCFDHGDSSGSGRLVKAHEGCIDRLERDAWKRLADGKEVERLRQEVERLEAERDATQAKVERMTLHGVEDLLRDLKAAEAERDRLLGAALAEFDNARSLLADEQVAALDAAKGGHQ